MNGTKSIFASKTFWGAAIALLATGLQLGGVTDVSGYANEVVTLLGCVLAIYGRLTATQTVSLTGG